MYYTNLHILRYRIENADAASNNIEKKNKHFSTENGTPSTYQKYTNRGESSKLQTKIFYIFIIIHLLRAR